MAELTTAQSWNVELCPDPAMRATLNGSIAVTVTYNSGMDADADAYDENPTTGLALRVLYSALVLDTPDAYSFEQFWVDYTAHSVTQSVPLSLQLAIDACRLALSELAPHRTGMLLLVDETRKLAEAFEEKTGHRVSDSANRVYTMLKAVGRALDTNPSAQFNAALTTLDSMMFQALSTRSGRKIDWVCLEGLRQHEAEAMIMRALGYRSTSVAPDLVALLIADCARHPRTLEAAGRALRLRANERGHRPDWFRGPGELKLVRRMISNGLNSTSNLWAICAALNGVPLPYDAVIAGSGGMTFGDAIASGIFLNTAEAKVAVDVPRLSFLHLLHSAAALPSNLRNAILGMAAEEESSLETPRKSSKSPFGGAGFEGFLLRWLQLRFGLASASGNAQGLSIEELFALDVSDKLPTAVRESLRSRMATGSLKNPSQFSLVALPCSSFEDAASGTDPTSRRLVDEVIAAGGGVVTFIANNPAFDILLLVHEAAAGMPVIGYAKPPLYAIAIEARFSSPTSSLRTTAKAVSNKVQLFRAQLGPGGAFAALGVPADRVTYVIMASRLDGPREDSQQQQHTGSSPGRPPRVSNTGCGLTAGEKAAFLAQGVIVLDREGVARALTPTLVDRAFFLCRRDVRPRGSTAAPEPLRSPEPPSLERTRAL